MTGMYLVISPLTILSSSASAPVKRFHRHVTRPLQRSGRAAWSQWCGSRPCWPIIASLLCHPCLKGERSWIIDLRERSPAITIFSFFCIFITVLWTFISSQKTAVKGHGIMVQGWKKVSAGPDIEFPLVSTSISSQPWAPWHLRHCGALAAGDY